MRIILTYIALIVLTIPIATAQQKYYYTLGSKFKGLRKDQIKIIPTWTYQVVRAEFVYNKQKYKAYFNEDSNLTAISAVKNNSLCPAYIKSDLSCIYRNYKLIEWVEKEYYSEGKVTKKQTEVIISHVEKYESVEVWDYKDGVSTGNGWPVEFRDGEYSAELLLDAGGFYEGTHRYEAPFATFEDSLKKYVRIPDSECRRRFENKKLYAYIYVNASGMATSYGFGTGVPYILREQFESFCARMVFPPTDKPTDYTFNIILSDHGLEVVK